MYTAAGEHAHYFMQSIDVSSLFAIAMKEMILWLKTKQVGRSKSLYSFSMSIVLVTLSAYSQHGLYVWLMSLHVL